MKINIPEILIDLRAKVTDKEREEERRFFDPMYLGMIIANFFFASAARFRLAQKLGRMGLRLFTRKDGWIHSLPSIGGRWTMTRDLRGLPDQTFREWWASRGQGGPMSISPGSREAILDECGGRPAAAPGNVRGKLCSSRAELCSLRADLELKRNWR